MGEWTAPHRSRLSGRLRLTRGRRRPRACRLRRLELGRVRQPRRREAPARLRVVVRAPVQHRGVGVDSRSSAGTRSATSARPGARPGHISISRFAASAHRSTPSRACSRRRRPTEGRRSAVASSSAVPTRTHGGRRMPIRRSRASAAVRELAACASAGLDHRGHHGHRLRVVDAAAGARAIARLRTTVAWPTAALTRRRACPRSGRPATIASTADSR